MTTVDSVPSSRSGHVPAWVVLLVAVAALALSAAAITISLVGGPGPWFSNGMMSRGGMMSGNGVVPRGGMMAAPLGATGSRPGVAGFVPGTAGNPRVIQVIAGPGFSFQPATISVERGETVTFVVTAMGSTTHEFMVGPADAVAADAPGTPEIGEIRMMETGTLTYTFDGPGPYAFGCHAAGHYEAGMRGTINLLPA